MLQSLIAFLKDEDGASSAEYVMLAAGIAIAAFAAITAFGLGVLDLFVRAENCFPGAS